MNDTRKRRPSKLRQRVWTIYFTLAVTLVFGAAVSALHVVTQERIRDNEQLFLRRAVRAAAGLPRIADQELPQWFDEAVEKVADTHYRVRAGEGAEVDVIVRDGAGLWGRIRAVIGLETRGGTASFAGFAVLEQAETPGLGARIDEPWFAEQLKGKSGKLELMPEKTRSEKSDEIDGITGATITSVAVRDILNKALEESATITKSTKRSGEDG